MRLIPYCRVYENWAPVAGRVIFGLLFLMGASFKIPGTQGFIMEVGMTAAAGFPFATVAVFLAFLIEVIAGVSLIIGWQTRRAACVLAALTFILALVFYHNFADQMQMGMFVSHMGLIAGLLYISVYGAQHVAARKDVLPS
ncbi:MAG: DoxX family protein [Parcubacteria group bacterium]|nr:DoxX family protein [Parcubacteria group bacterium]